MGSNNINSREELVAYIKKYEVQFEIAVKKHMAIESSYKKLIATLEQPAPDYASEVDKKKYKEISSDCIKYLSIEWNRYSDRMSDSITTIRRAFKGATKL